MFRGAASRCELRLKEKFAMVCGRPSWKISKSPAPRSVTAAPLASVTVASTCIKLTLTRMTVSCDNRMRRDKKIIPDLTATLLMDTILNLTDCTFEDASRLVGPLRMRKIEKLVGALRSIDTDVPLSARIFSVQVQSNIQEKHMVRT